MDTPLFKRLTENMKTPEDIFLSIVKLIDKNKVNFSLIDNKHDFTDNKNNNSSSFYTNIINYSKMRNFGESLYEIKGIINLSELFECHYYFSNKRSYFSIDTINRNDYEKNIAFLQLCTLLYSEKLFKKYSIDEFIFNLYSNHNFLCKK